MLQERLDVQPYSTAMAQAYKLARSGTVDAWKAKDERGRDRWQFSRQGVEDFLDAGGQPLSIPPGFRWTVPDLREAMQRGELASLGPEDVRRFVRRKRAEAVKAPQESG
jgi:hypothetical protein